MPRLSARLGPDRASEVAARIRSERLRLGMTVDACAAGLGLHRNTYMNYERRADPSLSALVAFRSLGMDPRAIAPELFGEDAG